MGAVPHWGARAKRVVAWLWWLAGFVAACGQPMATPEAHTLVVAASTDMAPLLEELAVAFNQQSAAVAVEVRAGSTQSGLEALRAGVAQLAVGSWLAEAPGPGWQPTVMARDGLVVIVHPSNPVNRLGLVQLRDMFGGRTEKWSVLVAEGPIGVVQPVVRGEGTDARLAFDALVMDDARLTPGSIVAPSGPAVLAYVAEHGSAIGYVSLGLLADSVKAIALEGIAPSPATVTTGKYPLSHDIWLMIPRRLSPSEKSLVDFVLGAQGQQIIGQTYGKLN